MSERDSSDRASDNKPRKSPPWTPTIPSGWIWIVLLGGVLILLLFGERWSKPLTVPYSVFKEQLIEHGNVTNVKIGSSSITGDFKDSSKLPPQYQVRDSLSFTTPRPLLEDPDLIRQLDEKKIEYDFERDTMGWLMPVLIYVLPTLLLLGVFLFVLLPRLRDPMGGGFLSNYVKSPAKRYEKSKLPVTFDDVADMENAKRELQEVVDFLRNPEKFQKLGGQIPKGVLLVGPPGTGKTLLARAVAGEAGVPFFSISGSEFIQMFVGVGASRVRDLFKTARENSPCILFIDEIDAVGRVRGAGLGGGHDEREQIRGTH